MQNKIVGKRLIAEIIDTVICYFLAIIPSSVVISIFMYMDKNKIDTAIGPVFVYVGIIIAIILYFTYNMIPLINGKSTLGYKIMKLKIVDLSDEKVTKSKAFFRTLIKLILIPFMFTYVVPAIYGYILFKSGGEFNLLDKIVKTKAVQA
jgi:uncharacterized RDD family membrane protein YckC